MLEEKQIIDEKGRLREQWYEDENGLKQGEYKRFFRISSEVMEEGIYKDGEKDGLWKKYSSNGLLGIENYKEGKREGEWKEFSPLDNELLSLTNYSNDNIVNQVEYKNGQLFREINMKLNEKGINEYNGKYYLNDGTTIKEGVYSKNGFTGTMKKLYSNGNIQKSMFLEDDFEHGECKKYYDNGQLKKEFIYKNGVKDGKYKEYYENGQLMEEGQYVDGKKEGEWKKYNSVGKLDSILFYDDKIKFVKEYFDDELISTKEYFEDKTLIKNYKNEILDSFEEKFKDEHNTKKYYNSEGKLQMVISDKEMIGYYPNGNLKVKANMKDTNFKGDFEEYWENGNLKSKCFYVENNGFSSKNGKGI